MCSFDGRNAITHPRPFSINGEGGNSGICELFTAKLTAALLPLYINFTMLMKKLILLACLSLLVFLGVAQCPFTVSFSHFNYQGGYYYSFTDNTSGLDANATFEWDLNGFLVSNSSAYGAVFQEGDEICEIVTDNGFGCSKCYTIPHSSVSNCNISPNFTYTPTSQFVYSFTNASTGYSNTATFNWEVQDTIRASGQTFSYTFPGYGHYQVCIDVADSGCTYQFCQTIVVSNTQCPTLNQNFLVNDHGNGNFEFDDFTSNLPVDAIVSWTPAGVNDTGWTYYYTFLEDGDFYVCETISRPNCSDVRRCKSVHVYIPCPSINQGFYVAHATGDSITLVDTSRGPTPGSRVEWFIENGEYDITVVAYGTGTVCTLPIDPNHEYNIFEQLHVPGCDDALLQKYKLFTTPSGIKGINDNPNLTVSPNPGPGVWQLQVSEELLGSVAEVYNTTGQLVYKRKITSIKSSIEIPGAANGIYQLHVVSSSGVAAAKLVKGE